MIELYTDAAGNDKKKKNFGIGATLLRGATKVAWQVPKAMYQDFMLSLGGEREIALHINREELLGQVLFVYQILKKNRE